MKKEVIQNQVFAGERGGFMARNKHFIGCRFEKGESPLKETRRLCLSDCSFGWKYPLWYGRHITVNNTHWEFMARAGVWYTDDLIVTNSLVEAPKNFRKCKGITLENVQFPNAQETLWWNKKVALRDITAKGDYFGMKCSDVKADHLTLEGNYAFDGCTRVEVTNSRLISKDAFWNCRHVKVSHSYIEGEYLAWNSDDVELEDCTIVSLQGLCYVRHLVLKNCRLKGTSLAFEYSDVKAEISDEIDSVINPSQGVIKAPKIHELILEKNKIDPSRTRFEVPEIGQQYDRNIYEGVILDTEAT